MVCTYQAVSLLISFFGISYIALTFYLLTKENDEDILKVEISLNGNSPQNKEKFLLEEYSIANQKVMHYERMTWLMGSVLIAGSFAALGWIATSESISPGSIIMICTLGLIIITIWWQWFERHRRIDLRIYGWIWAVEKYLGYGFNSAIKQMDSKREQDSKWKSKVFAPHGKHLARVMTIAFEIAWICPLLSIGLGV